MRSASFGWPTSTASTSSNLNRIRTGVHNLGVPKVFVTAREIAELDPYLDVKCLQTGSRRRTSSCSCFNGGRLDVVLEECDSLDIKVIVRHEARRHGIPVVMDTSDRGMLDIERFDLEPDRPIFHGLAADLSPDSLSGLTTEQKLPYILRILGAETVSPRLRASLLEIEQTISTWPQLASEVTLGGAAAAHAARRIALGQADYSGRIFVDLDALAPISAPAPPATRGTSPRHRRRTCLAGVDASPIRSFGIWSRTACSRRQAVTRSRGSGGSAATRCSCSWTAAAAPDSSTSSWQARTWRWAAPQKT